MDKNKNRTDLLAAGRKKLQQYRQKKDGKGSKSSGKANKPDPDVVTDESSSVAKPTKGKKQLSAAETPVQDSVTELADSSNADVATPDLFSSSDLPIAETPVQDSATELADSSNADVATPDLSSTSDLPIEVSEVDVSNNDSVPDAIPTVSSPKTVDIEEKTESSYVVVTPVDEFTQKAGEYKAASGEDQVPDVGSMQEHDHSFSEPDNTTSLINLEEDIKIESAISATEQNSEQDGFPVFASTNDDSSANNADLQISSGTPFYDPEPVFQPKEDVMAGIHGDSEVTPVSLTQLAKMFQNLNEDEFRFVMSARESVNVGDLKNDGFEFCERLREQLYINNFEKELIYMQLCEESVVQKEFDQHRLQWFNEKSSFSASINETEGKNKILTEELEKCRSELDRVTHEMENIQMDFSFSKTELDRSSVRIQELEIELEKSENQLASVSSELVDSRNLLSDLQSKNENLNLNVSSLIEEKQTLEKEKEDGILENEKLEKELIEFKLLMESLQVENVNFKENLALVMEEKVKLENEKENYVSEKESLLTELVELKTSNEQFVEENKKISMELLESQQFVESLQSEIAKFDNERTKFEEEISRLTVEKVESLTELTNCRSLMKDLQVEYEKSMIDLKNGSHRLEQLTEENVTLTSTLDTYKAKIQEFDDLKLKFEQKTVQDRKFIDDNSQHLTGGKLEEHSNSLEETFLKNVVLDEVMKQYVLTVEAKKSELLILCEELKQESIITKTKNSELTEKLSNSESRIHELQAQVDELQQLETIYRKLEDASIGSGESEIDFGQNVTTRVTTSVDQTLAMIHNLQTNLEDALKNNTLLSDSCKEMTEKIKDLETTNELSSHVINKVFENLQKIVNDSSPNTQESEDDTASEQLDHLEISNYEVFIDKLIMMLRERAQLESKNREYNLELIRRMKDLEELNKRCINPDVIAKLFENIQCSVTLTDIEIKPDEPVLSLESVIQFLIKNLKFNETKSIELQNEIEKLTFSVVPYEIETRIFKESLISAMEQLARVQSEIQLKETEFHQSEQRVNSLREKLHIAVTKGKGLIQQRDSLKQNLTATSNELEKCLHELQLKDATIQETETKLKNYSEAGERMEALESELSYIRNSATALRESFLLKDSVLQRIEEILEDLDLPEDFHVRDIIDKIDWLAKSVSQNSFSVNNSNQTNSIPIERTRSYPESGSRAFDNWRENLENLEQSSNQDDELRRNYEDLQNKFYGLAEHNEMLEQSLTERNNLVQRFEEVLDKINMPQQLRSLEPEDRIEWLRVALLDANDRCALLQQDINDLEKVRESLAADLEESQTRLVDLESTLKSTTDEREQLSASLEVKSRDYDRICEKAALYETEIDKLQNDKVRESLAADLEESQRRLVDFESTLKSITDEREQLSASLEAKTHDYDRICEKTALYETEIDKLQNKIGGLQLKLDENRVNEEHLQHIHGEIVRLQNLVKEILQVQEIEDFDSNVTDIQCLEGLLRKLADKHITELTHSERSLDQSNMHAELARKLEEVEGELVQVKDERDKHVEKSQTLVNEIEALQVKNQELQNLLVQEEQKTATVNEKSQSLVNEIEALQVKNQELQNLLVQEEQKTATVKEKLNVAVRKGKSLVQVRDSMKQTINDLTSQVDRLTSEIKARENTILEFQEKMKDLFTSQELIENKDAEIHFLKNRLQESESELQDKMNNLTMILTALGEIDLGFDLKTNDPFEKMKQIEKVLQDLQDAISSAEQDSRKSKKAAELLLAEVNEIQERNEDLLEELSRITTERDSAEAAKRESLTRIEQISNLHLEERNSQFSELMNLKSGFDQLKPGLSKIYNLLDDVFPKDLDHLYNLEASVKSLLESSDTSNIGGVSARSASKVNAHSELFLDSKTEQLHNDNNIVDLWRFIGSNMQNLIKNINGFEEKLQTHSKTFHEKVIYLSETMTALHKEITSHKSSIESAKEEISWLESNNKQKETENIMLRKYISTLYEACKNSVSEIEKNKGELVENDFSGEDIFSEERITNMVNRLLSLVKDFHSIQSENIEVNLKEMKSTISNLQKELTEKDVQKDRICVDLVNQIKRAEATAMSHLQELEPAKAQINDLKEQCKLLEEKVKELESQETVLVDLHEKVKSLSDALTAKEQENEALLQALDEEEAQMEDVTNKITKLEKLVQQKDLDLETVEAARAKTSKKLSITVNKFDELHHLSETLVSEVDKLQSQLQERDSEISFLRDEITRCTSDSLQALETDKKSLDEIQEIYTWLDSTVSGVETNIDETKIDQVHEYKEILKKQITSIISELKDLKQLAQNKDDQLHIERSKVDDLMRSLRDKESRLSLHENDSVSAQGTSMTSEIVEVEPVINKWSPQGSSRAPQVRSLRKVNNDQLAISIDDVDSDDKDKLEDDDDDKAHGFKSLTTSKFVPRFTRPVTDFVDGLWVSCDRTLMRQPVLRLSLIFYWAVMHALLAVFVV